MIFFKTMVLIFNLINTYCPENDIKVCKKFRSRKKINRKDKFFPV